MTLFQSPMTMLLFLAALALTLLGKVLKKGHTLSFLGGIGFALCAVSVYVDGGTTQEVLILALIMLLSTFHRRGDGV